MEERMKENIKWEVAEAEKNLDKLIEERNRYEKKLENLFNQSKVHLWLQFSNFDQKGL